MGLTVDPIIIMSIIIPLIPNGSDMKSIRLFVALIVTFPTKILGIRFSKKLPSHDQFR
jgi:uncharacterized membrane protein